ncbi:PREDICTED: uncharacterized protein LOC108556700 [Nicrophorus vespilloides]|uniref:Uncharacterized protein LOC108556700 n=1 Tax=Nicrophorus vespilloides TaxID=110193 RepID=A0ABM1M1E8_NICVS|nr:PREDICTED: uncharacterized protein LOC108556700 [Nicrophorus vespilloides]
MQRLPAIQVNSVAMVSVEQVASVQEEHSSVVTMRKSRSDTSEAGSDASEKSNSHHSLGRSLRWKLSRRWVNRTILIRSRSIDPAYGSRRSDDEAEKGPKARRAVSMSPFANKRIQIPPCPSPSLLAEDPPSSENVSDLEDVRGPNDPALLNG